MQSNRNKVKFGDIATGFDYGMNSSATEYDGKNKYIRITDIDESSGNYNPSKFVSPDGDLEDKYLVKVNDILLTRTGASVGKSYLNKKNIDNLYFAGFLIRANINNADPNYVYQFLQSNSYDKFVIINSARSGQPGLNADEFKNLEIPIPRDYEAQVKIGKLLSLMDKLIYYTNEQSKKLGIQKTFLLNRIFNDKFDNKRKYKTIAEIGNVVTGKTPKTSEKELWNGYIPFITPTDMNSQIYIKTDRTVSSSFLNSNIILTKNAVCYTSIASIGKMCMVKDPSITNQQINSIIVNHNNVPFYIYYYLEQLTPKIKSMTSGFGMAMINKTEFSEIELKVHDYHKQQKIGKLLSSIDQLIELYNNYSSELHKVKNYNLNKIFG